MTRRAVLDTNKRAKRYSAPLRLRKDLGIERPPQSFCYLE